MSRTPNRTDRPALHTCVREASEAARQTQDEETRREEATRALWAAGALRRLSGSEDHAVPEVDGALLGPGLTHLEAERDALTDGWKALALRGEAHHEAITAASGERAALREPAEAWVEQRDRAECVFDALRPGARRDELLKRRLLGLAADLGDLDDQALEAVDLLIPAADRCREILAELDGVDLDPRGSWWLTEPVRAAEAAAEGSWDRLVAGATRAASVTEHPVGFRLLPQVAGSLLRDAKSRTSEIRLAAASTTSDPLEAARAALLAATFPVAEGVAVQAALGEDGETLALLAVDEDGRPTDALAGRTVRLQTPTAEASAVFEGVQAVLSLAGLVDALEDAELILD